MAVLLLHLLLTTECSFLAPIWLPRDITKSLYIVPRARAHAHTHVNSATIQTSSTKVIIDGHTSVNRPAVQTTSAKGIYDTWNQSQVL